MEKHKKVKKSRRSAPPVKRTVERARKLVESMLVTMEEGLLAPEPSEQWERLFGTKDSAVVSLQKLVQVIGLLSSQVDAMVTPKEAVAATLSKEEMALLTEWLQG